MLIDAIHDPFIDFETNTKSLWFTETNPEVTESTAMVESEQSLPASKENSLENKLLVERYLKATNHIQACERAFEMYEDDLQNDLPLKDISNAKTSATVN